MKWLHSKNLMIKIMIQISVFQIIFCHILIDQNEYSFKSVYHSDSENENVPLMNSIPSEIIKMIIDDEEVEPSLSYTFPKKALI